MEHESVKKPREEVFTKPPSVECVQEFISIDLTKSC